eukprot:COSAG02_NODE_13921_length_1330_cov_1.613323_2_plen_87_part_00
MCEREQGSFVIDYSPRLGKTQPEAFETLATVPMATSWCNDQPFSVFRKRALPYHLGGGACYTFVAIAGLAVATYSVFTGRRRLVWS